MKILIAYFMRIKNKILNNLNIFHNMGWLVLDKLIRMGLGLLVGVWVARYLGPEQYGLLSYAQAFVALFSAFATLGLDGIVIRNIIQSKNEINVILGTAFSLKLIGGIILFFVAVFCSYYMNSQDHLTTYLIAIIAIGNIIQAFDALDLWFQSQVQSKYTVWSKNTAFLLTSIIKIICILSEQGIICFAILGVVEILLGSIGLVMAYQSQNFKIERWKNSFRYAWLLLKESWPLMLSSFAIIIYMKIDQVMLKQLLNDSAVGIYTAGTKISEIWYFIPMAIVSSISPKLLKLREESYQSYEDNLQRIFSGLTFLAYLIIFVVTVSSTSLIDFLFGSAFKDASLILDIHILQSVFIFTSTLKGQWIVNEGLIKYGFCSVLLGGICNVIFNCFLIPQYSYFGAAFATFAAHFVTDYISGLFYQKARKVFYMQTKAFFLYKLFNK